MYGARTQKEEGRRTIEPSWPQQAILDPTIDQILPQLPDLIPTSLHRAAGQEHEPPDPVLLDREVHECRHRRDRIVHFGCDEVDCGDVYR